MQLFVEFPALRYCFLAFFQPLGIAVQIGYGDDAAVVIPALQRCLVYGFGKQMI